MTNTENKSTTSPNLCGDAQLSLLQKLIWLYNCHRENTAPDINIDPRIEQINYLPNAANIIEYDKGRRPSPVRMLCDTFWSEIDLSPLCFDGNLIRVLEAGCGTGVYAQVLNKKLGEMMALYRGVDIHDHKQWAERRADGKCEFFIDSAENIHEHLQDINLIITQSAIEHFEHDLLYFLHIANYVKSVNYPVWQIHLFPSIECLPMYLWHGYRQYSIRTVSKITRLFDDNSKMFLYRLGGTSLNKVHMRYVTWPSLFLRTELTNRFFEKYKRDVSSAIHCDQARCNGDDASFYALIIKSNSLL